MKVRVGWSGEERDGTWNKQDVELEESDFESFKAEYGLKDDVSAVEKYLFLENEATAMLTAWVAKTSQRYGQSAKDQFEGIRARRQALLGRLSADSSVETVDG